MAALSCSTAPYMAPTAAMKVALSSVSISRPATCSGTNVMMLTTGHGRLYYRTEKGTMLLIEPNPKEYVERGRFEQPDRTGQPAWGHPVIANGKLYVRDQDLLLCYNIKAQ